MNTDKNNPDPNSEKALFNFNVEFQYQQYLRRMALEEKLMHPAQRVQLRQTFYGAFGQLLILMRDKVSNYPEDQAVQILQNMLDQCNAYWVTQGGIKNN
jgi:hypothetical protein